MRTFSLDRSTALQLQESVLRAMEVLGQAIKGTEEDIPPDSIKRLKRSFGQVIADLDHEMHEPLYRAHPELREHDAAAHLPYPG